jgi:hypothetical protein
MMWASAGQRWRGFPRSLKRFAYERKYFPFGSPDEAQHTPPERANLSRIPVLPQNTVATSLDWRMLARETGGGNAQRGSKQIIKECSGNYADYAHACAQPPGFVPPIRPLAIAAKAEQVSDETPSDSDFW